MARRGIRWLRAALLTLFLLSAAGIVYLLRYSGSDGSAVDQPATAEQVEEAPEEQDLTYQVRSSGFRQVVTEEDRVLFDLAADEHRINQDEETELEGVTVGLERDEGRYVITSERGTYLPERREALLVGNVVVNGPQPFQLWADWLELKNQGNVLVAAPNSRLRLGAETEGTSGSLSVDLQNQVVLMSDGVDLSSLPGAPVPFSLKTETLRFVDSQRLIRSESSGTLRYGANSLSALRISIYLDEFSDQVRFVRALWKVEGTLEAQGEAPNLTGESAASGSPPRVLVDYSGMNFAMELNAAGEPEALDLRGTRRNPVRLATRPANGVAREARAGQMFARFEQGKLSVVDALNRLVLEEWKRDDPNPKNGPPTLRARSETGALNFDQAGELVGVDLEERVVIEETRVTAQAARASIAVLQGVTNLFGEPMVEITSADGLLRAPRAIYRQDTGLLEAVDGVRARLEGGGSEGALAALGGGDGNQPVYVEAQQALLGQDGGETFSFRDDVRAWQGRNLLLSQQLRGSRGGDNLTAVGSVRTLWYPEASVDQGASEAQEGGGDHGEEQAIAESPVEVRSGFMEFEDDKRTLRYEETVKLRTEHGLMSCERLTIALQEGDQQVETMLCDGGEEQATLIDEELGRQLMGDSLLYDPNRELVEVDGNASAAEGDRRISGGFLTYDLETGNYSAGRRASNEVGDGDADG